MKSTMAGIKVGAFIIVVAVLGWFTFHAVTEGLGDKGGYKVYALFNDATGLVDKSMVQIAGLRIGEITNRRLHNNQARVDLRIKSSVILYENASVTKKPTSIMGGFYLEIDPGTSTVYDAKTGAERPARRLRKGDRIKIVFEPKGVADIVDNVSKIMPEIKKLVVEVRKLATTNVKNLVDNTNKAITTNSTSLNNLLKRLDSITKDIKMVTAMAPRDVNIILREVKSTVRNLRSIVGRTGGKIDTIGDTLGTSLKKVSNLIDKLDGSLNGSKSIVSNTKDITKNVKEITDKIKNGEGTVGKFITSSQIADDVEKITGDVKNLLGGFSNIETVVGLRSEYNLMANTVKTYISVAISPRQDKYYLIELIDDPRGMRNTSYTVTRTDNPEIGPPLYREEKITVTDAFRITFMFAKKIDFFTFRFGIKESTGGGGMDIHLLNNKFLLSADIFDFSSNIFPRVKIGLQWEFYRRMFLVAGVDDVMNERPRTGAGGGRDYFIGAQVRFTDEDLKSLLMIAGGAIGSLTTGSK